MRRAFVVLVAIAAVAGCARLPGLKPNPPGRDGSGGDTTVSVARAIGAQPPPDRLTAPAEPAHPARPPATTVAVRANGSRFVVYDRPVHWAQPVSTQPVANDWGQALWLPVIADRIDGAGDRWYRVRLPIRPNGTAGWVRAADVTTRTLADRIEVDLSAHRLVRYEGRRAVLALSVGIGASSTPTPPGHFFVWASIPSNPAGSYGAYILGLSGFSQVIRDGRRMAIHGTADPSDSGRDVSEGCVRVFNGQLPALEDVPLGTPVWIHR